MAEIDLEALAGRVEATDVEHDDIFVEAFNAIFPKPSRIWEDEEREEWTTEYDRWNAKSWVFSNYLDAGAWLNGALLLVPEGLIWGIANCGVKNDQPDLNRATATCGKPDDTNGPVEAATPALALTAAALRARLMEGEGE